VLSGSRAFMLSADVGAGMTGQMMAIMFAWLAFSRRR
jgi:hypothetical protein